LLKPLLKFPQDRLGLLLTQLVEFRYAKLLGMGLLFESVEPGDEL
jgi:hypothetical protein